MDTIQHTKLQCVDNQNIRGSTEDGLENNMKAERQKVIDLASLTIFMKTSLGWFG